MVLRIQPTTDDTVFILARRSCYMSSEEENLNRGDVAAQEQERIIEDAEKPIKQTQQTKRRDTADRGEAVAQEQERIIEEEKK